MAVVYGQIDTLKRIKNTLTKKGITQFSSIGEINEFSRNYKRSKDLVRIKVIERVEEELNQFVTKKDQFESELSTIQDQISNKWSIQIEELNQKILNTRSERAYNFVFVFLFWIRIKYLEWRLKKLIAQKNDELESETIFLKEQIYFLNQNIINYRQNRDHVISEKVAWEMSKLNQTMQVVREINPLIAGAIGEAKVQAKIRELSDKYHLINDYYIKFRSPIFNKKNNDRIYSIQIDHVLVSQAGVFILETKNWSKKSVQNLDMRSPVQQLERTSYALFVLLNGSGTKKFKLNKHHWGNKKIPIRSVVTMINEKPKAQFKFVHVLSLNELNNYITFFDPVLESSEVVKITDYLLNLNQAGDGSSYPSKDTSSRPRRSIKNWLQKKPGKGINDFFARKK